MSSELFDMVPDALVVVDEGGRIVQANRQAETLFGYPAHGLDGLSVEQLMPESARARHRTHRTEYMGSPRIRPMGGGGMALIGQRRDGAQFPVEIALSPLRTGEGPRYLASIRDISETQRARQALVRARYDALVARIGQQALESANEAHFVASLPPLLAETLGVDVVAVAFSRNHGQLDIHAAVGLDESALTPAERQQASRLIAEGKPLLIHDRSDDRRPFPLAREVGSGAAVPLPGRDRAMGALVAWSSEMRRFDHDALHLLQSAANLLAAFIQRRRTEEQLAHSQRLDAIGQLTGGVAHDFNNLLTVLSGNLQLLELENGRDPESGELIASALRSVARGAELTGKLLAFARRQRLDPEPVVPARLLRELEPMLSRTLGETIQVEIACNEQVPPVFADPAQLDSALLNLVLNARDAMPCGGRITVAARDQWVDSSPRAGPLPGHYIVFSVADTGHGMTPETLARAIEPFYTTKEGGRGSGLGLSMVYGFVEQSGGHLALESNLGYGTRAEIYLPVAPANAVESIPLGGAPSPGCGELVLAVEDEAEVRKIASGFIESLGYRVLAVGTAEEALRCLDAVPDISALFSDVMLGSGLSGKELAVEARRRRPGLAVLLTSGYDDPSGDGGGFEVLRKPYLRGQLAEALQRSLKPAAESREQNA